MNSTPLNILLADDDTDDCIFFKKALEELPLATELTIVRDGEQLSSYLDRTENLPDVLFLDISMPRKNGIESLAEIKENERLKDLHVVMFTISFPHNSDFEMNIKNMLTKIGAEHYISKTSDFERLKKVIHDALIVAAEKKAMKNKKEITKKTKI